MAEPIIQRKPDTERALVNKYNQNPNLLSDGPPAIQRALLRLDQTRASKGQNPLSIKQTENTLTALRTNQAATPMPEDRGFFGNLARDATEFVTAIPKLPAILYNEAKQLPEAPEQIAEALSNSSNPLEAISNVAQAPGVRMLPGSFIAANITDPGELLQHPLYTFLDVLPAGKAIGRSTGATAKVGEFIKSSEAVKALGATRPGQVLKETFAPSSRELAQMSAQADETLREQMYGTKAPDALADPTLTRLFREADELRTKYSTIDDARRQEITTLVQEDADSIRFLSGDELSFVNDSRRITDEIADYSVSQGLLTRIDGEIFDNKTAGKILSARQTADISRRFADVRKNIEAPDPANFTPESLLDEADSIISNRNIKPADKRELIRGIAYGLEANGIDARGLLDNVRKAGNTRNIPVEQLDDVLREAIDTQRQSLTPFVTDEMIATLTQQLQGLTPKSGAWADVKQALKDAGRDTTLVDQFIAHEKVLKQSQKYLSKLRHTERSATKAAKELEKVERRYAPARYQPALRKKFQQELQVRLVDDPNFPELLPYLQEGNYSALRDRGVFTEKELQQLSREITGTWKELKDAGFDPLFVHAVSPGSEFVLQYPRVLESLRTPSQQKERLFDATPSLNDISIALPHQAMELVARRGSERLVAQIQESFGRLESEVLEDYLAAARRRSGNNPGRVMAEAKKLMDKEWVRFEPEDLIDFMPSKLQQINPNTPTMIPRSLANNLKRTHNPPAGRLSGVMDPVMSVFRTSLLPLSPRWHMYNVLSGGLLLTITGGPQVWSKLGTAYQMVKSGDIPEGVPKGMGSMPRDVLEWNKRGNQKAAAIFNYSGGQTLRRIWDSTQQVRDAGGRIVQKSYDFNSFIDDTYRTMAYLQGSDNAITKGMSKEAAQKAGIELARKTLQNWDRMTPIERTIMRYVFPFYGWMQHIIRYTLNYPIDHPIRTAIMAGFARAEIEDRGTSLPERFLNTFFLGEMDENGNQLGINLAGINPFADVSNYFTLAGFMGQTNPIITSLLESVGVDPQTGGPELFPNLRYDPETGRLRADSGGNPLTGFVNNIVPQTRILQGMFDSSSEYQELLRSNPEAATRMLISSAGLPLLFREYNIPEEVAKAEISRMDTQTDVFNDALRTGNWSEARKYPQLSPILDQIQTLQRNGVFEQAGMSPSPAKARIQLAQDELLKSLTGR